MSARLRAAVNRIDVRNLIEHLEWLGGDAANVLLPPHERRERMWAKPISISPGMLDNVLAILRARARPGRTKIWTREVEGIAMMGLLAGKPLHTLARQIAAKTGQSEGSVRTQLQNLKKSHEFKRDRELSAKYRPVVRVGEDFSVGELETMLREAQASARQTKGAKKVVQLVACPDLSCAGR